MRRYRHFAVPCAALLLASAALCQTIPQGVRKVTSVEGITEYVYPNGLHLLLFPDPSKPKLTVNVTYLVGSRHEGTGEGGMAHLLEHMLFLRTKSGKDVKKELTDHGAQWNGTTSDDRTNYFEIITASEDNLRWAIGLEAERMTGMRMEKQLLDTEMTVVRNEFENSENNPFGVLYQRVANAAFTAHSYGRSTIGNRSDIEHVPIERLNAFYQKYYQPDNAVMLIAGQFDESKALALVAQTHRHDSASAAQAGTDLYGGTGAGRRTPDHLAADRRQQGDHDGLPYAGRCTPGQRPARSADCAAGRPAFGQAIQGAGGQQEGRGSADEPPGSPRSGPDAGHGDPAGGPVDRRCPRDADQNGGGVRKRAAFEGRSGTGQGAAAESSSI